MTVSVMMLRRMAFDASVRLSDSIGDVVHKLSRNDGAVVVVSDTGELAGIITDRDVVTALDKGTIPFALLQAKDIMTTVVATCTPQTTELEALKTMVDHGIRHLPVLLDGAVVAIIGINDAVKQRLHKVSRVLETAEQEADGSERLRILGEHAREGKAVFEFFRAVSEAQDKMGLENLSLEARQILWLIGDHDKLGTPLQITDLLKGHRYGSFPTVRRHLQVLENENLVKVTTDASDSRRKNLTLSDRGHEVFKEIARALLMAMSPSPRDSEDRSS